MNPVVVSDRVAIGEVPSLEQIEILAKAGFRSLLNNQPDGEVERLPASTALAAAARANGLACASAPLSSRTPSEAELLAHELAVRDLPAPIYAFCYSGARSAAGCALMATTHSEPQAIIAEFAAAGFDIAALAPWLADERKRRAPRPAEPPGASQPGGSMPVPISPPEELPPDVAAAPPRAAGIVVHARVMAYGGHAL